MQQVKWAEFELQDIFEVKSSKKRFDANKIQLVDIGYPYVVRIASNNGIRGFLDEDEEYLNDGNTISFGQDTATMFYQEKPYFTGDKIKILKCKTDKFNKKNAQFFIPMMSRAFSSFSWGSSSFSEEVIKDQCFSLPIKSDQSLEKIDQINFDFMENFITQLEAYRLSQLEAYLLVTGLKDYQLTIEEEQVLVDFQNGKFKWQEYNLQKLFGKSTRGKRLKSADRIDGNLPFVTAGEADTGISAFIGNAVEIFKANTTTIDMFGSAKYRNYDYGGDDHIAVVHTEKLNKFASIFVTSAIHKASYTGKFSYSRNFYAKDADELNIFLPEGSDEPDYQTMQTLISAVQKLVIKEVVRYADNKIAITKQIIDK
ncbi:restriction endonuclease subunit S [Pelistega ratti]|uniref:restriction endonuclease subunit S n=1 Tax=Pelistega ratti TaxID=2652177 RepID=UPI001358F15A|nr:restriction endonuclease subunit S [Pelistega ratti]